MDSNLQFNNKLYRINGGSVWHYNNIASMEHEIESKFRAVMIIRLRCFWHYLEGA